MRAGGKAAARLLQAGNTLAATGHNATATQPAKVSSESNGQDEPGDGFVQAFRGTREKRHQTESDATGGKRLFRAYLGNNRQSPVDQGPTRNNICFAQIVHSGKAYYQSLRLVSRDVTQP